MVHRRALVLTTNLGLIVFVIVIFGAVAWTIDEAMGWDLAPEQLERLAESLIFLLGVVAAFAALVSAMCSLAVIAEANAVQAGLSDAPISPLTRWTIWLAAPAMAAAMYGLHLVNEGLEADRLASNTEQLRAAAEQSAELFTPEILSTLSCVGEKKADIEIAQFLDAVSASVPSRPEAKLLLPAESPYQYCIVGGYPLGYCMQDGEPDSCLVRHFLTSFPSEWEAMAVKAAFAQEAAAPAPAGERGAFLDASTSIGWAPFGAKGEVRGVLLLRGVN